MGSDRTLETHRTPWKGRWLVALPLLWALPAWADEAQTHAPAADGAVYEGELSGGLYHGQGRLTWPSGTVYEGEFRHGLQHGEGTTTRRSGEVHTGNYAFGERHGMGRVAKPSGATYEGDFENGERSGEGTLVFTSGGRYEGEFRDGDPNGKGRYVAVTGHEYRGDFRHGEPEGHGEYRWPDGDTYVGGMKNGDFDGIGRLERNGFLYVGDFAKGDFEGRGTWSRDGESFEGTFVSGEFTGEGTHQNRKGDVYTGGFVEWSYQGKGVLEYKDGRRYEGDFVEGRHSGQGVLTWSNGARYEGDFERGSPHGEGEYVYATGETHTGSFSRGQFHGEGRRHWTTKSGEERVAKGVWEKGRYVEGNDETLLSPPKLDPEELLGNQPELVREGLANVERSRPGATDLYFLGFGAWDEQDVFKKEVRFAEKLFAEQFAADGRTVSLINHRETLDSDPLATVHNLELALNGLAERMNPEEDVLFLFLSSHGSEEGELGISLEDLPLKNLKPKQLDRLLDEAGIAWRVVVVSSCYSGGFVEPLADENTLVVTAARSDRKSFGCSSDAEFTYFGGAFLRDALPEAKSFAEAFEMARQAIDERESMEKLENSEPQISTAAPIERKLAHWRAELAGRPTPAKAAPPDAEER